MVFLGAIFTRPIVKPIISCSLAVSFKCWRLPGGGSKKKCLWPNGLSKKFFFFFSRPPPSSQPPTWKATREDPSRIFSSPESSMDPNPKEKERATVKTSRGGGSKKKKKKKKHFFERRFCERRFFFFDPPLEVLTYGFFLFFGIPEAF